MQSPLTTEERSPKSTQKTQSLRLRANIETQRQKPSNPSRSLLELQQEIGRKRDLFSDVDP